MYLMNRIIPRSFWHANNISTVVSSTNSSVGLVYEKHGDPKQVLALREVPLRDPTDGEIVVKFLASPINPADINMIEGVYPIKPPLPAVGGNEGVAEVILSKSSKFSIGDWIVPNKPGLGTWQTAAVLSEKDAFPIPNNMPTVSAAVMSVNPCTAYRLLHDFVNLKPGDFVIQNASTSGVGQAVIQIAKHMLDVRTINIIRNKPDLEETVAHLRELGADVVVTDDQVDTIMRNSSDIQKPKLALNCVGGKSVVTLLKHLEAKGTLVTYGNMSRQAMTVPAGPLIFKNIHMTGFWMTLWTAQYRESIVRNKMWNDLCQLVLKEQLLPPRHTFVSLSDFKAAFSSSLYKQILLMN